MAIMERFLEQAELFPIATDDEIKLAKSLLSRYRRMKLIVDDLERNGLNELAPKSLEIYQAYTLNLRRADRAINLIQDDDVRRMIDFRYRKGQPHNVTVSRFNLWHPSTIDRKINRGIEAVANTLKLWG